MSGSTGSTRSALDRRNDWGEALYFDVVGAIALAAFVLHSPERPPGAVVSPVGALLWYLAVGFPLGCFAAYRMARLKPAVLLEQTVRRHDEHVASAERRLQHASAARDARSAELARLAVKRSRSTGSISFVLSKQMDQLRADIDRAEAEMHRARRVMRSVPEAAGPAATCTAIERRTVRARLRRLADRIGRTGPTLVTTMAETAVRLAGERHAHLRDAWLADLAGDPEEGLALSGRQRAALAFGFVVAGVRIRVADATAPAWRPVDWLLSTDARLNAFVTASVGVAAVYFDVTEGLHALLVERSEPCALLGGGLYALARWIRRRRAIEVRPAAPRPRDAP